MERRKFMIGAGALATGSSAAVGTGAFSQATASGRSVTVQVVDDESGYLGLVANDSGLENNQYASLDSDGRIELNFDSSAGGSGFAGSGEGVAPDSEYYFDNVFGVANLGEGATYNDVTVDASDVTPDDAFGVYSIGGRPDMDSLDNANIADVGGLSEGHYNGVGIAVNTDGLDDDDEINGTITVSMDGRVEEE